MKRYLVILCMILGSIVAKAQSHDRAVADIDLDGVSDTVSINRVSGVLTCRLSRSKFKVRESKPVKSLTSTDYEFIGLTALPGTFQLLFLSNHSSCYFSFVYDKKRKKIYLDEHWSESPGDDMGDGAYEFTHNLRRRCVYYWVRSYTGSTDPENYDKNALHTERVDKRVRKLRLRFEKFSDEKYYAEISAHIPRTICGKYNH